MIQAGSIEKIRQAHQMEIAEAIAARSEALRQETDEALCIVSHLAEARELDQLERIRASCALEIARQRQRQEAT